MHAVKLAASSAAFVCATAAATPFDLTYRGAFAPADAFGPAGTTATAFAGVTPFTLQARFDTATPSLVRPGVVPGFPGFPGFVAYAPLSTSLTFGGQTYLVAGAAENPTAGVSIAIFDPSNVFNPGLYGIGVIAQPLRDGTGFVGDFSGASPAFSVADLVPTTFTGYNGAGFLAGVGCLGGPASCVVTPLALTDARGAAFSLVLGSREEEVAEGAPSATATLSKVPSPGSLPLVALGLAALLAIGGAHEPTRGGRAAPRRTPSV